jgi:hypothetical protein
MGAALETLASLRQARFYSPIGLRQLVHRSLRDEEIVIDSETDFTRCHG